MDGYIHGYIMNLAPKIYLLTIFQYFVCVPLVSRLLYIPAWSFMGDKLVQSLHSSAANSSNIYFRITICFSADDIPALRQLNKNSTLICWSFNPLYIIKKNTTFVQMKNVIGSRKKKYSIICSL